MGPSVFNVDGGEPYTVHAGRGGVQCPGAENVERYNARAGRGRDQFSWYRGCKNHVLITWEGVVSSFPGVDVEP